MKTFKEHFKTILRGDLLTESKQEEQEEHKFDYVVCNPPYTFGGKGSKTAIPAFLNHAMECGSEVVFVCPAWYALRDSQSSSKWGELVDTINEFGVKEIIPIDQKKYFPDVDFMHGAITHLAKRSNGRVSSFSRRFKSPKRPDKTDVERIETRRGFSLSRESSELKDSPSVGARYKIVTSVSNDGSGDIEIKYHKDLLAPIESPWAVIVQEQSVRGEGIKDAVVVNNIRGDVGVLANVYPIYCNSKSDAERVRRWVISSAFNKLLSVAVGDDPVLKVKTLSLCPKYPI